MKTYNIRVILFLTFFLTFSAYAQNQKCLICHSKPDFSIIKDDGQKKILFVDELLLSKSMHKERKCQDCHNDVIEISATGHKKNVQPVNCSRCHYEGNPVGAPQTTKYFDFQHSVHGEALAAGNPKAPKCQDCHGAHDIHSKKSAESTLYRLNVGKVCGKCHLKEYTDYYTSIHGKALGKEGAVDVPSCTNCHGEHDIKKTTDNNSSVSKNKLAATCSACHSSTLLMQKYGINTEQIATYKESFHGIASEFGEKKAANCASCHGVHDIKPESDPTSSIYPGNIPKTCGKCHPDANANYAKGKIHLNPKSPDAGPIYYISNFFKYLTISTLAALFLHIILDLRKKLKHKKKINQNS